MGPITIEADIHEVWDADHSRVLGWIATIDHEYPPEAPGVIYAIGNTREECIEKFERAIVAFNEYFWNGPPGGWKSGDEEARLRYLSR